MNQAFADSSVSINTQHNNVHVYDRIDNNDDKQVEEESKTEEAAPLHNKNIYDNKDSK